MGGGVSGAAGGGPRGGWAVGEHAGQVVSAHPSRARPPLPAKPTPPPTHLHCLGCDPGPRVRGRGRGGLPHVGDRRCQARGREDVCRAGGCPGAGRGKGCGARRAWGCACGGARPGGAVRGWFSGGRRCNGQGPAAARDTVRRVRLPPPAATRPGRGFDERSAPPAMSAAPGTADGGGTPPAHGHFGAGPRAYWRLMRDCPAFRRLFMGEADGRAGGGAEWRVAEGGGGGPRLRQPPTSTPSTFNPSAPQLCGPGTVASRGGRSARARWPVLAAAARHCGCTPLRPCPPRPPPPTLSQPPHPAPLPPSGFRTSPPCGRSPTWPRPDRATLRWAA